MGYTLLGHRLGSSINLDEYLAWRRHLEASEDPNEAIFKRFDEYDFDNDTRFQQGLPSIIGQLIKDGKGTLDKAALQKEMTKAKAFYYARYFILSAIPWGTHDPQCHGKLILNS